MDELQQLHASLGVASTAEALAAINRFNAFLNNAKVATGKTGTPEVFEALNSAITFAKSIEAATQKSGDDAVGLVRAAMSSHAALPAVQAKVAELEAEIETHELDSAIAKAKADKKWTPALEAKVREEFTAKNVTLAGAKSWLENATVVPGTNSNPSPAPANAAAGAASGEPIKHNGKTFAELSGTERVALKKSSPELYADMRKQAADAGRI